MGDIDDELKLGETMKNKRFTTCIICIILLISVLAVGIVAKVNEYISEYEKQEDIEELVQRFLNPHILSA